MTCVGTLFRGASSRHPAVGDRAILDDMSHRAAALGLAALHPLHEPRAASILGSSYRFEIDAMTDTATIFPKFQVVIPKPVRDALRLVPRQQVQVVAYDNRVELIPVRARGCANPWCNAVDAGRRLRGLAGGALPAKALSDRCLADCAAAVGPATGLGPAHLSRLGDGLEAQAFVELGARLAERSRQR